MLRLHHAQSQRLVHPEAEAAASAGFGSWCAPWLDTTSLSALAARDAGREFVVLSTCNRAEIYAVGDGDATAEAVEKLTARSLRDLKWTVNARNKFIAAAQREARE